MKDKKTDSNLMRGIICFLAPKQKAGQAIKLVEQQTIFGREKGDITLSDNLVSATHCQIQIINGEYVLFDMNSSNGTFVNGEKIVKKQLASGDKIAIGNIIFEFKLMSVNDASNIPSPGHFSSSSDEFQPEKTRVVDTLLDHQSKKQNTWSIKLHITYADQTTESHIIPKNSILIGRGSSYGKFENDQGVSRSHLLIKLNELGEIFIEDQGSTNGSYINDQKITGIHLVKSSDKIQIGSSLLQVSAVLRDG